MTNQPKLLPFFARVISNFTFLFFFFVSSLYAQSVHKNATVLPCEQEYLFEIISNDKINVIDNILKFPFSSLEDSDGNIIVADRDNNRIIKKSLGGKLVILVGSEEDAVRNGYIPEYGVFKPTCLAQGPGGEIYFSEPERNRIRKIDRNGKLIPVAGNGS